MPPGLIAARPSHPPPPSLPPSRTQLLRGLRAAFAHYTAGANERTPPPFGGLLTTAVAPDGTERSMREDVAATHPPLSQLIPCAHMRMQGYDTTHGAAAAFANLVGAPSGRK